MHALGKSGYFSGPWIGLLASSTCHNWHGRVIQFGKAIISAVRPFTASRAAVVCRARIQNYSSKRHIRQLRII